MAEDRRRLFSELDRRYAGAVVARRMVSSVQTLMTAHVSHAHRIGSATLPALILGQTADRTVTWGTPMPDANYETYVFTQELLGAGTSAVISKTAAAIVIRTTASGIISLGTRLLVIAWKE